MRVSRFLSLALLAACKRDLDGDGQRDEEDCDDRNAAVYLGAPESCNAVDDDCDGFVDEGVSIVAYWDRDGDGAGDDAFASRVCTLPSDGVEQGGDCDDLDPDTHPGGVETCNANDDDCNGTIDDVDGIEYYEDLDGDGHGGGDPVPGGCLPEPGQTAIGDDCDDDEPLAWDGAAEVCDGVDNDCNGAVDDGAPLERVWEDNDGDGYGDPGLPAVGCGTGGGLADNDLDCDDGDPNVSPDADDVSGNGLDEDCDGYVDELGVPTPYATIDDALAVAQPGDVVQLDAGVFFGSVDLTDLDVTFAGEGCDRTTLYGDGAGTVVTVNGGRVEGLTVSGGLGTPWGPDLVAVGGGLHATGDAVVSRVCFVGNDVTGYGAGAAVTAGTLTIEDSAFDANFAGLSGGGAWAGPGATLLVRRDRFTANQALGPFDGGGAIATHGGVLDIASTVFAGNVSADDGGAVLVSYDTDPVPVPEVYSPGTATIRHATFHANTLLGTGRGQAIYNAAGVLTVESSVFTGHDGLAEIIEDHDVGEQVTEDIDTDGDGVADDTIVVSDNEVEPVWIWSDLLFWDNTAFDYEFFWIWDAAHEEVRYVDVDPSKPAAQWDLRLLPGSAGIDAAGDLDPDGSAGDLGGYGGPEADPAGTDSYLADAEGDGLEDGWELWAGTNPWIADATSDDDGDGATAAAERSSDADPRVADTDADGVTDAGDAAPRDPSDHAPVADAGLDRWTWVGELASVGGDSWDPNLDPLSWSWSLVAPAGSALTAVDDPTAPIATFTPDVAGAYTLTLTVGDGATTRLDTAIVTAGSGVRVPLDAPDVASAIAMAVDGGFVGIDPGVWVGALDLAGKDLTLVGLGERPEDTVLDGGGAGITVQAHDAETLTLANLTVTGGAGLSEGGGISSLPPDTGGIGGVLTLSRVIVRDNVASVGGGVYTRGGVLVATDTTFSGNHALTDGGGLFAIDSDVEAINVAFLGNIADNAGGGVSLDNSDGGTNRYFDFTNTTWQGNVATIGFGTAFHSPCDYATARFTLLQNVFVGHAGKRTIHMRNGTMQIVNSSFWDDASYQATVAGIASETPEFALHHVTTGVPLDGFWGQDVLYWPAEIPVVDPGFVRYDADGVFDDLLFGGPGNALVDAGMALFLDADGSRSDIGLAGGPLAPRSYLRFARDVDADGMSDGWEVWFGLDPAVDDSAADADGDGASNLAEYLAGTDP